VYEEVCAVLQSAGSSTRFFRGHSNANWKLLPGVARLPTHRQQILENVFFFDFVTRAGALLKDNGPSWTNVFAMQHHGLPTRLLDWSEAFGIALFFAMREGSGDAAVWVLDPFRLNKKTRNKESIADPTAFPHSYYDYFIASEHEFGPDVVALSPPADHPRVFHQRGCFTLHREVETPLEDLHPDVVTKIVIPASARGDAGMFLRSVGISEFSLFPDLDGLARELKRKFGM
jgi:hypothetical protein